MRRLPFFIVILAISVLQLNGFKLVLLRFQNAIIFHRFLVYNPILGRSHVHFMSKISDILVEAGHEVVGSRKWLSSIFQMIQVMLSPIIEATITDIGADKVQKVS